MLSPFLCSPSHTYRTYSCGVERPIIAMKSRPSFWPTQIVQLISRQASARCVVEICSR